LYPRLNLTVGYSKSNKIITVDFYDSREMLFLKSYFNANVFYFLLLFIFNSSTKEMPGGGMDALALLYFAKKLVTTVYVRTIGVCGYGYIYGYPWIYPSISTENLWIWIWIWMANFISKPEFIIPQACRGYRSMDISMDITLAHLLIKLTTVLICFVCLEYFSVCRFYSLFSRLFMLFSQVA